MAFPWQAIPSFQLPIPVRRPEIWNEQPSGAVSTQPGYDPLNPQQRSQRRASLSNALQTFLFSLSQGMSAAGNAPNHGGNAAAFGGALAGPYVLEQERYKRAQEQAQLARDAEERSLRIEQIRDSMRRGQVADALAQFNAMKGTVAQEIPDTSAGLGLPVPFQNESTPMPLPPVPGFGSPPSAQNIDDLAMRRYAQQKVIDAATRPGRFVNRPDGTVLNTDTSQIIGTPTPEVSPQLVDAISKDPERYWDMSNTVQAAMLPALQSAGVKIPPKPSPRNPLLDELRGLSIDNLTQAVPGQVIMKATGRPVPPQFLTNTVTTQLNGYDSALAQADVVKQKLDALGSTGAISGYVYDNGLYWPVAQKAISKEAVEAVAETRRFINQYIYAVSGAQINEKELDRIGKTAPSIYMTSEANTSMLNGMRNFIQRQRDGYLSKRGWAYKGDEADDSIQRQLDAIFRQ